MFRINEVVEFEGEKHRILTLIPDEVIWILINDGSAFPTLIVENELKKAIDNETLIRVKDPYEYLAYLRPEEDSTARKKRDRNYEMITPIITNSEYFVPKIRSTLIQEVIVEYGTTKRNLYKLLRRYWQRGQTPNTLIPDYKNSGGKGGKRIAKEKKLGRPRKYMPGIGAKIDDNIERLFRIAIDKYVLSDKGVSFPYVHRRFKTMYENHFPDIPESEIASKWQMLHFYKREYDQVEKIQKRTNKIEYNKDVKPLTSTANTQVLGPGSRYEIDATIADIYLLSDSDRRNIVGRPVIYMVIDVFSRLVAGFYVGFENPSYVAAMQALAMSMTNKVDLCKSLGFDIDEDEWPVIGIPDAILGDKGELLGHQIESLESSFSVRIENTPSYRGDAKGIVERSFGTLQADFKPFSPGIVSGTKIKKRGGKDYRLDAKLTIQEFKEIILSSILFHNQYKELKSYDRDVDMPADLTITPLSLWIWGLQHRTGRLRIASEDALRVTLLPRLEVTISDLGVNAYGLYFTSQEILKKGWLHRSKEAVRPVSLEAAYDPASADYIYIFPQRNNTEYWICSLTERSREFRGSSFWDVWQIQDVQKKTSGKTALHSDKKKRTHEDFVQSKIKSAIKKAPRTDDMTNRERTSAIRGNKNKARDEERKASAYKPDIHQKDEPADIISLNKSPEEDYSYPDFIDELFDDEDE